MNPSGIIIVAAGLFSFAAGLFNWQWFMNARKVRAMARLIGPAGVRVFYMILGLAIAVYGVLLASGMVGRGS